MMDKRNIRKKSRSSKPTALVLALALILMLGVGGTVAYLVVSSQQVTNTFQAGKVTCEVNETFTPGGSQKTNVTIKNTGNIDAYIRAAVVVTWKNSTSGNLYAANPVAGTDYTITYGSDWVKSGDYYYYPESVAAAGSTPNLIVSAAPVSGKAPGGYVLDIQIIAEAIQSEPADAATEAWGVDPSSPGDN